MRDQFFTHTECCLRIILRHKLHNLFEVSGGAVGDQDFETHRGIALFTSSTGRTRPASTSFKPRSKATSSAASSGSAFVANNSAASNALSCAFKCAIAVFISCRVLIPSPVPIIAFAVPILKPLLSDLL